MKAERRNGKKCDGPNDYNRMSEKAHVLTCEQAEEFERRQAEPPRQPTEAERELVRMFRRTVKR